MKTYHNDQEETKSLDELIGSAVADSMNQLQIRVGKEMDANAGHVLRRMVEHIVWMSCNMYGLKKAKRLLPETLFAVCSIWENANVSEDGDCFKNCIECDYEDPKGRE